MTDSATIGTRFGTSPLPLEAAFDGGRLTSDGGLFVGWRRWIENWASVRP